MGDPKDKTAAQECWHQTCLIQHRLTPASSPGSTLFSSMCLQNVKDEERKNKSLTFMKSMKRKCVWFVGSFYFCQRGKERTMTEPPLVISMDKGKKVW